MRRKGRDIRDEILIKKNENEMTQVIKCDYEMLLYMRRGEMRRRHDMILLFR